MRNNDSDTATNTCQTVHQHVRIRNISIDEFWRFFKILVKVKDFRVVGWNVKVAGKLFLGMLEEGSLGARNDSPDVIF